MSKGSSKPPSKSAAAPAELSRRKRQVMDAVYAAGSADVQGVLDRVSPGISYSAARATLNALVDDGMLSCSRESRRMVYAPVQPRESAAASAVRRVLDTFFGGSVSRAMAGMLGAAEGRVSKEELDALRRLVRDTKPKENP